MYQTNSIGKKKNNEIEAWISHQDKPIGNEWVGHNKSLFSL